MRAKLDALLNEAGVAPGEVESLSLSDFALRLERARGDVLTPQLTYVWDGSKYVQSVMCKGRHPDAPETVNIDAYFARAGRFG